MADLDSIFARQTRYQDAMVSTFEDHLRDIVRRAQTHVLAELQRKLSITDGVIDSTSGNMRILRGAGKMFMDEMDKAGYQRLVTAFVGEFKGTLPFLQETIARLGESVNKKWPSLDFTQRDLNLLSSVQVNAAASITDVVDSVAGQAITKGMFGLAGLRFGSLVEVLTEKFEESIGKARTIADTAMSTWYRTAADRAYQIIEKDVPEMELRYEYSGPNDFLVRPFCRRLLSLAKSYTREQIDSMSNNQLPMVFLTGGGWNCRHQWILSVKSLEAQLAEAA